MRLIMTIVASWALCIAAHANAGELTLPSVIGETMVLQRGMAVPIWGWAEGEAKVTVTFNGQVKSAVADKDGKWMVKLDPLQAGGPFEMTIRAGEDSITLGNVLVGEVWVCSGQSNMWWPLKKDASGEAVASVAGNAPIRLFLDDYNPADQPQRTCKGIWRKCDPNSVADFSAVAYYFGRDLQEKLGVPVGLIQAAVGGSWVALWTSAPTLRADNDFKVYFSKYKRALEAFPSKLEKYKVDLANWEQAASAAKDASQPTPIKPVEPQPPRAPSWFYNGMIAPLMPYAIAGVIWYQGESDAMQADRYRRLFPAMINDWRRNWGQGDFPFLFVQLPNIRPTMAPPSQEQWPYLRDAQRATLCLPRTAMAVTIDVGDPNSTHPTNKLPVGLRLSLAAQAVAYGKDVVYSGPAYESMKINGSKAMLTFKHVGGSLEARGSKLKGFVIAGEDRNFLPAEAKIDGKTVIVWGEAIPNPIAVRYAWASNPDCNLYNKEGLPASPFRTDDWPKDPNATP